MNKTPIEWTDWSVNPLKMRMPDGTLINVCVHKSDGCRFCYAEGIVKRWWKKKWGPFPGYTVALLKLGTPVLVKEELEAVIRLSNRIAEGKADPNENKIFWNDMTDEALEFWPDEFLDQIWAVRALTQNLIHQVLTKRPDRMLAYLTTSISPERFNARKRIGLEALHLAINWKEHHRSSHVGAGVILNIGGELRAWPLPNVIVMTSVENQPTANERIPVLLQVPAAYYGISAEPLLAPIDLTQLQWRGHRSWDCLSGISYDETGDHLATPSLNWIICGGESGSKARPMHPAWPQSIRDQCVSAGIPFFFKQWGEWSPTPMRFVNYGMLNLQGQFTQWDDPNYFKSQEEPGAEMVFRLRKSIAGRQIDGREWNEFPSVISNLKSRIAEVAA